MTEEKRLLEEMRRNSRIRRVGGEGEDEWMADGGWCMVQAAGCKDG